MDIKKILIDLLFDEKKVFSIAANIILISSIISFFIGFGNVAGYNPIGDSRTIFRGVGIGLFGFWLLISINKGLIQILFEEKSQEDNLYSTGGLKTPEKPDLKSKNPSEKRMEDIPTDKKPTPKFLKKASSEVMMLDIYSSDWLI